MWPAEAVSTGFSLLECIWNSLPMRSFLPLVELMHLGTGGDRARSRPARRSSLPKNGCVATLNASAENGSLASGLRMISFSGSRTSWPIIGGTSSGEGR